MRKVLVVQFSDYKQLVLPLNKKNIKNSVLFCSVLKLHYLCTRKEINTLII